MPIVGASPALAPLVGGYLTDYVSWRAPFVLTAALGVAAVALMLAYIPETLPEARRQRSAWVTFRNYPMLMGQPRFWTYAINLCVAYAAYLGYLAASPVILEGMGLGPKAASTCYISLSITYICSNLVSRHFAGRYALDRLLGVGYAFFALGALCLVGVALAGVTTPWPVIFAISIITLANGFLVPLSFAGGVTSFPATAGAASGLMGALHLAAGAAAIYTVAVLPGTVSALAAFVASVAAFGCVAFPLCLRLARQAETAAQACPAH